MSVIDIEVHMEMDKILETLKKEGWQPVKHGHWIIDTKFGADVMSGGQMVICSVCGRGIFYGEQNYCPHCGAKMDGDENDCY